MATLDESSLLCTKLYTQNLCSDQAHTQIQHCTIKLPNYSTTSRHCFHIRCHVFLQVNTFWVRRFAFKKNPKTGLWSLATSCSHRGRSVDGFGAREQKALKHRSGCPAVAPRHCRPGPHSEATLLRCRFTLILVHFPVAECAHLDRCACQTGRIPRGSGLPG